ncbi:hypothetical protein HR45_15605 [Shewanella mangrovi]|uniref:Ketoreductase domain-containing protein n=2 Tax=Shewanella mangrovi TaxID=1515746 RepID=A0A094LN49_9GAMM|nr:hypothetical protein HR45_15605 [Shewanella mangrovi]
MRFNNRTIVITGAASGLGRAFAIALAQRGAELILIDSHSTQNIKAAVEALGGRVSCWLCDVANEAQVEQTTREILKSYAHVDGLLLSAGIHLPNELEKMPTQDWRRQIDVDLDGAFLLSRAFWPLMKQQNYGRVVLLTGASALFGDQFECAFATAKMGLLGLASCMSQEGAEYNIHVNTLCAQALTPMTSQHLASEVAPMFSMETPVAAATYLLSDEAPTGQHLLAAAGSVSRAFMTQSKPHYFQAADCTAEAISKAWPKLLETSAMIASKSGEDQIVRWAKSASKEHGVLLK